MSCPSLPRRSFWSSSHRSASYAGRFDDLICVGSGSMGTVYRAWDCQSGTEVALKIVGRVDLQGRFAREAHVLATMEHGHIVGYVGHGVEASGQPWLAMEWLDGEDLATRLDR